MKKMLMILVLFLISISLKAEDLSIKFYLPDGNYRQYKLEDLSNITFIKSAEPYLMVTYSYGSKQFYDIRDIDSLFIYNVSFLIIEGNGSYALKAIASIDSINFIPGSNEEIILGIHSWMKNNLDVVQYRNGDTIPQVTDPEVWKNLKTGAWCYYNNDPESGAKYGKLYNGWAVCDPRGLAPTGTHIATDQEWSILNDYLGGDTIAGGKLKSVGTIEAGDGLWLDPNTGATNETTFGANPAGYRYDSFAKIGEGAYYWSNTEADAANLRQWSLSYDNVCLTRGIGLKEAGMSVRYVVDYNVPTIIDVDPPTTYVNRIIRITGTSFGSERKKNYVTFGSIIVVSSLYISWSDTQIEVVVPLKTESGKLSVTVNGIRSNEYDFLVYEDDPDTFEPIPIGDQVWMSRNLNVDCYRNGDAIPQVQDLEEWKKLKTGAWCYYNNDKINKSIYGKLYNWYAVNDSRGLAPVGWHIPREEEWTVLVEFLGGSGEAGGKMKTQGTTNDHNGLWKAPNFGATNESNFSALPGGFRSVTAFEGLEISANFWSDSESDIDESYSRQLHFMEYSCVKYADHKYYGYSVRCVKD